MRLYLDGFNEIPKQYIESNQWSADFNTLLRNLAFSLIISSRTDDGLRDLRIPIFNLDSIDKNFIISNLTQNQLELKGIFRDDILTILQKPFFYKLVYENKFQIDLQTTPRKIYSNLLSLIYQRFVQKFEIEIDLSSSLSKAAMDAMDAGQEVFDADVLKKYIELELMNCQHPPNSIDIINWLVSQNFLIPIKNERVSFFHQSVTEYLAATRLATLFSANNAILKEKLKYRRWDQTIYLTLSLLKESDSNIFLDILLKIDFELAISATKYIEHHSDKIVAYLLEKVLDIKDLSNLSFRIADILSTSVPLSGVHLPALRKLIKKANILGGAAVECVINLLGNSFKEEALQLLLDNYDNFNFCSTIGKSLKPYITKDDLPNIISKCKEVQEKLNGYAIESIEDCDGFIEALSHLLANNSPQWLYATLFNPEIPAEKQTVHVAILDHILQDSESQKALEIYLSLLFAKGNNISTGLSLLLEFSKYQLDYSVVTIQHINALLFCLQIGEEHNQRGALQSLYQICKVREDLTVRILQEAEKNSGILKAALYYIISQDGKHNMIFNSLEELLKKDLSTLDLEPFYLLVELYKLNWKGQERLFVNLLKLRNNELARYLCAGVTGNFGEQSHLNLEIGPINWWLDWFSEYEGIHSWFFLDRVVTTIVQFIDYDKRREFIKEFNIPTSIYRQVISQVFLIRYDELTLRDFTDESITFLLENLNKTMGIFHFDSHPLEKIATEAFVSEVMIPRLSLVSGEKKNNLRTLIEKIGKRHNRRYLID